MVEQEAKYKAEFLAKDGLPELQKTPPRHLDPTAKNEYKRIINSMGKLPLRNLDRSELELYCTWYSIYKKTVSELHKEKDMDKATALISTIDKATRNIKGLASDLGLNVNSRMQMNMPDKNNDDNKPKSLRERYSISS